MVEAAWLRGGKISPFPDWVSVYRAACGAPQQKQYAGMMAFVARKLNLAELGNPHKRKKRSSFSTASFW